MRQLTPEPDPSPTLAVLPPAPAPTRASKPRTRNGKIARLPKLERDMVSRMLRDNIPHQKIVNALDEVGIRVTQRNISNWKTRGGYREWCLEQDRVLESRISQDNLLEFLRKDDASQLPEVGLQFAATCLSQFLSQPEAREQLVSDPQNFARMVGSLCRLTAQLHTLQKHRDDSARRLGQGHDPDRRRFEDERDIERTRLAYSSTLPENPNLDEVPHRNYLPKPD